MSKQKWWLDADGAGDLITGTINDLPDSVMAILGWYGDKACAVKAVHALLDRLIGLMPVNGPTAYTRYPEKGAMEWLLMNYTGTPWFYITLARYDKRQGEDPCL